MHGVEEQPPVGKIRRVTIADCDIRTDGRIFVTAGDGGRLEDIMLRNLRIEHPWLEDPASIGDADLLQGSRNCPEARTANASIVAENVDRLEVEGIQVRYPKHPPEEDFIPKYSKGELIRDPRKDFKPMPGFVPFLGKGLREDHVVL